MSRPSADFVLECSLIAPVPIEAAFRFFQNPSNLARITPPSLNFVMTTTDVTMRQGAEIDYRIRWAGVALSWKTLITEYNPPHVFADEQKRGPYRLWRHRHTFRAVEGGTEVSDRVEYALPFGLAGRAVHRLLVARQLRVIFAYRQKAVAEILGSAERTTYTLPRIERAR